MERRTIGILTDMIGPVFGGGYQGTLFEIAKRLARHHDVRVFTSLPDAEREAQGVRLERVLPMGIYPDTTGSRGPLQPWVLPWLWRRDPLGSWDPELLLVEAMPFSHLPALGGWIRQRRALKVLNVDEAWVGYSPFPRPFGGPSTRLARWLLAKGLAWADVAMAVSPTTERTLRTSYGVKDVILAPSGIDVPRLREQLPPADTPRDLDAVQVGRLVPMKRPEEFLRALGILRVEQRWRGHALLLGEGVARPKAEAWVRELGLAEQVELPGRVPEPEKMRTLARSRAFVLSSEREGFSLATLEAMLAGAVPIVAVPPHAEVFGVEGLVEEGRTGWRYPLGDVAQLAERLAHVWANPEESSRIAAEAQRVAAQYDWDRLAAQLERDLVARLEARESRSA